MRSEALELQCAGLGEEGESLSVQGGPREDLCQGGILPSVFSTPPGT